jgi:chromosome segregation ATPase
MKERKNQKRGLESVSHFFLSAPKPCVEKKRVSIQVAARTLGVSKGTIITYLNKGLLTRIKEDGGIFIDMDEVRSLGDPGKKGAGLPAAAPEARRKELESLKAELDSLKENLQVKTSELAEANSRIKQLEGLLYVNRVRDDDDRNSGEVSVRLVAVEKELKRLDRSWWKRLRGDL